MSLYSTVLMLPATVLLIALLIYLIKTIDFDYNNYFEFSMLNTYLIILICLAIIAGIIALTGYEGVSVNILSKELEYYDSIFWFRIRKKRLV